MTDPEQPAPSSSQADPDELAALFLRGRDVPCPNCGYNRRDGTGAACPECVHALALCEQVPGRIGVGRKTAGFLLYGFIIAALLTLTFDGYTTVTRGLGNPFAWMLDRMVPSTCLIITPASSVIAVRRRQRRDGRTTKPFAVASICFVISYIATAIWWVGWVFIDSGF